MSWTTATPAVSQTNELFEYALVAHPDAATSEKIMEEKKSFEETYEQQAMIRMKPHITIAGFLAKEMMEATLVRWVQNICNLQTAFPVVLNNFSGFPPHTIYVRVLDPKPFGQLAAALKILDGFIQANDCPPLHVAPKPHLTIAEGLPENIYHKAIKYYSRRLFYESFRGD
jgi:hypothetical protein